MLLVIIYVTGEKNVSTLVVRFITGEKIVRFNLVIEKMKTIFITREKTETTYTLSQP